MRRLSVCLLLVTILWISGCSNDPFKLSHKATSSDVLCTYIPTEQRAFSGDGGYYHEVQSLTREDGTEAVVVTMMGQVQRDIRQWVGDADFQIIWTIDGDKIIQTLQGDLLNDSMFSKIVLLKLPLEIGNQWSFEAKDAWGESHEIIGKIEAYDPDSGDVDIVYADKGGYEERRVLKIGLGTTDFTRRLTYKAATAYTGYHIVDNLEIQAATSAEEDAATLSAAEVFEQTESINVEDSVYALVYGFNTVWAASDAEGIKTYIAPDSEAAKKVTAVSEESENFELVFETLKIYAVEYDGERVSKVRVLEKYQMGAEKRFNDIVYEIAKLEAGYKISDFYPSYIADRESEN